MVFDREGRSCNVALYIFKLCDLLNTVVSNIIMLHWKHYISSKETDITGKVLERPLD